MRAFQFPEDLKLCQAFLAPPTTPRYPETRWGQPSGAPTAEVVGGPQSGKSYPQLEASSYGRFKCSSNLSPIAARPSSRKWSLMAWCRLTNGKRRYHINLALTVSRLHIDLQSPS